MAPKAASKKGKAKARKKLNKQPGLHNERGQPGVRGLLKTADIEVNVAVGLARPCSPFGGAADSKRFAHSAGPVK